LAATLTISHCVAAGSGVPRLPSSPSRRLNGRPVPYFKRPITGRFMQHIAALTQRYGKHLFVCFDDERIPATTNMLEGFFGRAKRLVRRAAGSGSTTNSVAHNLGQEFLVAFARFEKQTAQPDYVAQLDVVRFRSARAQLAAAEAPASHRRSLVRNFERHLDNLRAGWGLPVNTPDTS